MRVTWAMCSICARVRQGEVSTRLFLRMRILRIGTHSASGFGKWNLRPVAAREPTT